MNVIVAADKNWGIGKNNQLLVSIPADMKMFREETSGKVGELKHLSSQTKRKKKFDFQSSGERNGKSPK